MNDLEPLVEQSRQGDSSAFGELVRRTSRLVYVKLWRQGQSREATEDLVCETYLRAWRGVGKLTDTARFRPWLLAVARSVAMDHFRKRKRQVQVDSAAAEGESDWPSAWPGSGEVAEDREEQQRALTLLRKLPEKYRSALELRYLGGLETEEVARQLGVTLSGARSLIFRGLRMLRDEMTKTEAPHEHQPNQQSRASVV